jgi:hypothetical protein
MEERRHKFTQWERHGRRKLRLINGVGSGRHDMNTFNEATSQYDVAKGYVII